MSKRAEVVAAVKATLQAAFAGAEVQHWRPVQPRAGVNTYVVFRDNRVDFRVVGNEHEHQVRFEIEVTASGSEIGVLLAAQLDTLIRQIGVDPTLGQRKTICSIAAASFDAAGDGFSEGVCSIALDVVYRTKLWECA